MYTHKINIGYFGDGPWAHLALKKLIEDDSVDIAFVMSRFDNQDQVLKKMAEENNIDYLIHPNINSDEFYEIYKDYEVDLNVSMSFNQIFKRRMINTPRMSTINCHAGKLPFYRGRNILNWALINDEKEFGITVHYVDEGIDTGDIILQKVYPITDEDDYGTLLEKSYEGCADTLYTAIKQLQNGSAKSIQQKNISKVGMYCGSRIEGDEIINWNQSSRNIFNFVRAITYPGPCARTYLGDNEIKIVKVQMVPEAPSYIGIPGQVIGKDKQGFYVKSMDSFINIIKYEGNVIPKIGHRFSNRKCGEMNA